MMYFYLLISRTVKLALKSNGIKSSLDIQYHVRYIIAILIKIMTKGNVIRLMSKIYL